MPGPLILAVGNLGREFSWAEAFSESDRVQFVASPQAAIELLSTADFSPELIVLAESRPGQFSPKAIRSLGSRAPLAGVWRVLGSWCEGESRSGRPPAGCVASYAHQWRQRWPREAAHAVSGHAAAWSLPAASSPEERLLALGEQPLARGSGPVGIVATQTQTAAALAEVCHAGGYEPRVYSERNQSPPAAVRAIVWDTTAEKMRSPSEVPALRSAVGRTPIVALATFPRAEDVRRAMQNGLAAVVSKPYLIHDLLWQIAEVIERQSA